MSEYIKREDALDAVLFSLVGTGHQSNAIYAIRDVPTADVVEVRHGEWESFEIPHMMKCSECGVSDVDIHRTKFAFCPYCGAKMDIEGSET